MTSFEGKRLKYKWRHQMENKARLFQWRAKLGSIMALLLAALTFISVFTGKNYFSNLPSLFPLYLEETLLHFYSIWKCACLLGFIRQLHDLQRRNFSCGNILGQNCVFFAQEVDFISHLLHFFLNNRSQSFESSRKISKSTRPISEFDITTV